MKKLSFILALLCASMMAMASPLLSSEYCQTSMGGDKANGAAAGFTWETNGAGDIIITLSEVDGGAAGTTNFRNTNKTGNGMCDAGLGKFKVAGGDATEYFERDFTVGSQVYTLKLKDGVDAPAAGTIITFSGVVEYETSTNKDAWPELSFSYTYGSKCAALDKPTNVTISANKEISFDAVTDATSYKVFIYWKGELFHEQIVTNGGTINYHPSRTGTYKVYVQAYGAAEIFSSLSDEYDWDLTAELAYLPESEWCETFYETNRANESEAVNVTWSTDGIGNIIMTLSPVADSTQTVATELRALMSIDNLKIGEAKADASTYFTTSYSGATQIFTLKDPNVKPLFGVNVYYDGMIAYRTGKSNNCWPTMHFTFVYGANCLGYNDHVAPSISDFSVDEKEYNSVTFHVTATDVDDLGTSRGIASYQISSDDHGFVTEPVTLDGSGNFTIDDLKDNETYAFTLSVTDAVGNVSTEEVEVVLPFNPSANLALNKTSHAGGFESGHGASLANDGDKGTYWGTWNVGEYFTSNVWEVDLGQAFVLSSVSVYASGFEGRAAHIMTLQGKLEAGDAWTTIFNNLSVAENSENENVSAITNARYLKFTTDKDYMIAIKEFEVYGTGYYTPVDPGDPTSIDNTNADAKAVKVIENGQLIIIKNGVRYNIVGSVVK